MFFGLLANRVDGLLDPFTGAIVTSACLADRVIPAPEVGRGNSSDFSILGPLLADHLPQQVDLRQNCAAICLRLDRVQGRLTVLGPALGQQVTLIKVLDPPPILAPGLELLVGGIALIFRQNLFFDRRVQGSRSNLMTLTRSRHAYGLLVEKNGKHRKTIVVNASQCLVGLSRPILIIVLHGMIGALESRQRGRMPRVSIWEI